MLIRHQEQELFIDLNMLSVPMTPGYCVPIKN